MVNYHFGDIKAGKKYLIIYRDCYNMLKNENDIDSFEEYKTIIGNAIDYIRER